MAPDERAFSEQLGNRIACCRNAVDLTQAQLAGKLGITQPRLAAYEAGRRRVSASLLSPLARALGVRIGALIGEDAAPLPNHPGLPPQMRQRLERLQRLPRMQQRFVSEMLDTVLAQQPG